MMYRRVGSRSPSECRPGTNSLEDPSRSLATSPIRDMIRMLATTYGLSVTSTPTLLIGDMTGPITYGTTYIVRPRAHRTFRRIRVHPIVRGSGIFFFGGADERQMLRSCYIIWAAAMQVAIRVSLLVHRKGISRTQHLRDHPLVFGIRTVEIHHSFRLCQLRGIIDPGFQWSCHSDPPAGPIVRR